MEQRAQQKAQKQQSKEDSFNRIGILVAENSIILFKSTHPHYGLVYLKYNHHFCLTIFLSDCAILTTVTVQTERVISEME